MRVAVAVLRTIYVPAKAVQDVGTWSSLWRDDLSAPNICKR